MRWIDIFWSNTVGYFHYLIDQILLSSGSVYGNYFWFLGIISIFFFVLEVYLPWRKSQLKFRRDFWLDFFYMYFNFFIFYLVLLAGLQKVAVTAFNDFLGHFGVSNLIALKVDGLSAVWQFLILFLIQDFTHWNVHRMLHKFDFLWKFHKLHHSVKEMGFAAHLRFHWMESIIYKLVTFIPLSMIGFGIDDFFYLHIFTITWGHFNHANFTIPLGPLKYILNNPEMHIWHHAKHLPNERRYGVNFGLTLSVWDYLFKTNYIPSNGKDIELGFEGDEKYAQDFTGQMIDPFLNR